MTEATSPILWVDSRPQDSQKRRVTGRAPQPLVPVTATLRSTLGSELLAAGSQEGIPDGLGRKGLPLVTRLRPEARAKSKRPYTMLAEHGLLPVAAGRDTEMVSQASRDAITDLAKTVMQSTRKPDEGAISSVESFRLWTPDVDALPPGVKSLADLVERAQSENTSLQLVFFPWVDPETEFEAGRTVSEALIQSGFVVEGEASVGSTRPALFVSPSDEADVAQLGRLYGLRAASLTPSYKALDEVEGQSMRALGMGAMLSVPSGSLPVAQVGILDSGIEPGGVLEPWVFGRIRYSVDADLDPVHGTFVAGLVVAAAEFNNHMGDLPLESARVLDAQVLPSTSIASFELYDRIREVVAEWAPKGISVWNCSFAVGDELDPLAYSELAQQLDELSLEFDVLFVQAVGNLALSSRPWPPDPSCDYHDGIASPSESVTGLAVGSISSGHGAYTSDGCPASYTRRGPSFGGMMKPDVTHFGGEWTDVSPLELRGHGIRSVMPGSELGESLGTSFATPIVSVVAANVWAQIERSPAAQPATPALVKGLVVHSAALKGRVAEAERKYRGAGIPCSSAEVLLEREDTFTTVHKATLQNGVDWWKDPFPIPSCLITDDDKLRAEVFMTICFSPLIDPAFDEECVRTSIAASWGPVTHVSDGPTIDGVVPMEEGYSWESDRVEAGKWSPIRTHYARFPRGKAGASAIGMKLGMLERMAGGPANAPVEAYAIVTLRGIEPGLPVHSDGLAKLRELQYVCQPLTSGVPVRVRV